MANLFDKFDQDSPDYAGVARRPPDEGPQVPSTNLFQKWNSYPGEDVGGFDYSGQTSRFGTAVHHFGAGLLPSAATIAAAAPAAAAGTALAGPVGGLVGGLVGGFGAGWAAGKAQEFVLEKLPDTAEALGQSKRLREAEERAYPWTAFAAGMAPFALTMKPGAFKAGAVPPNATTLQRMAANPLTSKLLSGGIMGGFELAQELVEGEKPDWAKVGIATGFGVIFNKPTRFGQRIEESLVGAERAIAAGAAVRRWVGGEAWLPRPGVRPMAGPPVPAGFEWPPEAYGPELPAGWRAPGEPTAAEVQAVLERRPDMSAAEAREFLLGGRQRRGQLPSEGGPATVAEAGEEVMGPGKTEDTFQRQQEPSPEAKQAGIEARQQEMLATGEWPPVTPAIDAIRRQMHPQLFGLHDELMDYRAQLVAQIDRLGPPTNAHLADLVAARDAAWKARADYQAQMQREGRQENFTVARRLNTQVRLAEQEVTRAYERRQAFDEGRLSASEDLNNARADLAEIDGMLRRLGLEVRNATRTAAEAAGRPVNAPAEAAPVRQTWEERKAEYVKELVAAGIPEERAKVRAEEYQARIEPLEREAEATPFKWEPPSAKLAEAPPEVVPEPPPAPSGKPLDQQLNDIRADAATQMINAGAERIWAETEAVFLAARQALRARAIPALGSPEEIYDREGSEILGYRMRSRQVPLRTGPRAPIKNPSIIQHLATIGLQRTTELEHALGGKGRTGFVPGVGHVIGGKGKSLDLVAKEDVAPFFGGNAPTPDQLLQAIRDAVAGNIEAEGVYPPGLAPVRPVEPELTAAAKPPGPIEAPPAAREPVAWLSEEDERELARELSQRGKAKAAPGQDYLAEVQGLPLGAHPLEQALSAIPILEAPAAHPPRSRNREDIARELRDRVLAALRAIGVPDKITGPNPVTDEILARTIAAEIKSALIREGNSGTWYTQKIEEAIAVAALLHPEIATDPNHRMAFTAALAITSQGERVNQNVGLAEPGYAYFKAHGEFPTDIEAKHATAMNANFARLNALIAEGAEQARAMRRNDTVTAGLDFARAFLDREFTVGDLKKLGFKIAGENVDTKVRGSAIFGPKIGQGFYQNLNGNFDPVTMDLWFMRSWGRLTGTLMDTATPEGLIEQRERLETELRDEGRKVPKRTDALDRLAREIFDAHERDFAANRALYDSGERKKSELTLAADRYLQGRFGIRQQPRSGAERNWMRDIVGRAREMLANEGIHVTNADLQAIWWYPEKELYSKLGGPGTDILNVDYAGAFANLVRKRDISDEQIQSAIRSVARGPGSAGLADVRQGGVRRAGAQVEPGGRAAEQAAVEAGPGVGEPPTAQIPAPLRGGVAEGEEGAGGRAVRTAGGLLKEADPATFQAAAQHAHDNHKFGSSVTVHSQDDYARMQRWLTADGRAGYALDGDNIVSVFRMDGAGVTADQIMEAAIANGGRRLDAFDTVLPDLYARHGFVATGRIHFNDEYRPENWNYERYGKHNSGRPDVVFMVYDPANAHPYQTGEGELFGSYEEADENNRDVAAIAARGLFQEAPKLKPGKIPAGPLGQSQLYAGDLQRWRDNWRSMLATRDRAAPDRIVLRRYYPLETMTGERGQIKLSPLRAQQIRRDHPDIPEVVWDNLPSLMADPEIIYPYRDGVNVVLRAATAKGEPIMVGVTGDQVLTMTPRHDLEGQTGVRQIAEKVVEALKSRQRVYIKDANVAVAIGPTALGQPGAIWPARQGLATPDQQSGWRPAKNVTTREDVINQHNRLFYQGWIERGVFSYRTPEEIAAGQRPIIRYREEMNASTIVHEPGHQFLFEVMRDAAHPAAPQWLKDDWEYTLNWLGNGRRIDEAELFAVDKKGNMTAAARKLHERWARGYEAWRMEGRAPSASLARVFQLFAKFLKDIYGGLEGLEREAGFKINLSDRMRDVYGHLYELPEDLRWVEMPAAPERPPTMGGGHDQDSEHTLPEGAEAAEERVNAERGQRGQQHARAAETGLPYEPGREGGGPPTPAGPLGGGAAPPGYQPGGAGVRGGYGAELPGEPEAARQGAGVAGRRAAPAKPAREAESRKHLEDNPLAPGPVDNPDLAETMNVGKEGNVRTENITSVEQYERAIEESKDRIPGSDQPVTLSMVKDFAETVGDQPEDWNLDRLLRVFGGLKDLGGKILAFRNAIREQSERVGDLMRRVEQDPRDDNLAAEYAKERTRLDMFMSVLSSATSEWGRAGRAFRNLDEWDAVMKEGVVKAVRTFTGRDLWQLKMEAIMGAKLDTPGKRAKFLRDAQKRSAGGMLLEFFVNNLISGGATHMTYILGNALTTAMDAGPDLIAAAAVGQVRRALGQTGRARVYYGETLAQFHSGAFLGLGQSLPKAWQATLESLKTGMPTLLPSQAVRPLTPYSGDVAITVARNIQNDPVTYREFAGELFASMRSAADGMRAGAELIAAGGRAGARPLGVRWQPGGQIPDVEVLGVNVLPIGSVLRGPGRMVSAIHTYFTTTNYARLIRGWAYRDAMRLGMTDSNQIADHVNRLTANPPDEWMKAAHEQAYSTTLMGSGGAFMEKLSALINWQTTIPGLGEIRLLKFIDPFVHIGGNIIRKAVMERTPLGWLDRQIRDDLMGRNGDIAQDTAQARMLIGTALGVFYGYLKAQGQTTGSGPSDPRERITWLEMYQPHSVKVGDFWYQVNRLGPMGMHMGIAADLYDIVHDLGQGEVTAATAHLIHAIVQNVLDESFMKGPSDLIKAMDDPGRYGEQYVRQMVPAFVPFSTGVYQMNRAMDPYTRSARTVMDALLMRVPMQSVYLQPKINIWGEPVPSPDAFGHAGFTSIYLKRINEDPVRQAALDLGFKPALVERKIRNIELTEPEYTDFAVMAGRAAKHQLDVIVRSQAWRQMPNAQRAYVMEQVVRESREMARGRMFAKYPHLVSDATEALRQKRYGEPTPIR